MMDNILFARLEGLEKTWNQARTVCDPREFEYRQHKLLYAVASFLLTDYFLEVARREKDD